MDLDCSENITNIFGTKMDSELKRLKKVEKEFNKLSETASNIEDKVENIVAGKVTPLYDLSWYVKWIASFFILCGVMSRSIDEVPKIYDIVFSVFGTAGWFWVGMLWKDRALIMLNAVLCFLLCLGILRFLFTM